MNMQEEKEKIKSSIEKYKAAEKEIDQLYTELLKYQYDKIKEIDKGIGGLTLNISQDSDDEGGTNKYYSIRLNGDSFIIDELDDYCEEWEIEKPTDQQKEDFKEFLDTFKSMLREKYLDIEGIASKVGIKESYQY